MTTFAHPEVAWAGNSDPDAPLVVLLHGRGSNEHDIIALAGNSFAIASRIRSIG
jgi:phospholipase/carboxylesterase